MSVVLLFAVGLAVAVLVSGYQRQKATKRARLERATRLVAVRELGLQRRHLPQRRLINERRDEMRFDAPTDRRARRDRRAENRIWDQAA